MSLIEGSRALLVLGMHRSGTSCLARVLNLLGAHLGERLLPAQPDNPTGFWEQADLHRIHDEALAHFGSSWKSPAPLPPHWWREPSLAPTRAALISILEREFATHPLWAVKDPRLCLLLPLWKEVLAELGCRPVYVLVLRPPEEVAASLLQRDGLPTWHSHLLWLRHMLEAEAGSRGEPRAMIRYADLLADWRKVADAVGVACGIVWPQRDEAAADIDRFLDPSLRHHRTGRTRGLSPDVPAWVEEAWRTLTEGGAEGKSAPARVALDDVRHRLEAADVLLGPWGKEQQGEAERASTALVEARVANRRIADERNVLRRALAEAGSQIQRQKQDAEALAKEAEETRFQLERATRDLYRLESRSSRLERRQRELREQLEARLRAGRSELTSLETALRETRADLEAHRQALRSLLASHSWRITEPLRQASRRLRRRGGSAPGLAELSPWLEILPDRPFRQRLRPPVRQLYRLGIRFFTYARPNDTSVAVRLFEEQGGGRSVRLLERYLEGPAIRDGEVSFVQLDPPLRDANRRRLLLEIASLDGVPGGTVTVALGPPSYRGEILSTDLAAGTRLLALEFGGEYVPAPRKAFAFVSGCSGDTYRYRCLHEAEMLRHQGYAVEVFPPDALEHDHLLAGYQVVVAHRVPHTPEFEEFVESAHDRGIPIVYSVDDLVFDPRIVSEIAAVKEMNAAERRLYNEGVHRYAHAMRLCDAVVVSTEALLAAVRRRFPELPVVVSRNRVSDEMVTAARRLRPSQRSSTVTLGYFSGTPTHRLDFRECAAALTRVLEEQRQARLLLVGHIDVPPALRRLTGQIDHIPFVDWRQLPELYTKIDVNLAPLERETEFTESKSELKYLEAGLLGVPTVASCVGGFRHVIRDGDNGFLCTTTEEWENALQQLVEDATLRVRIGRKAHDDVLKRRTTRAAAAEASASWQELLGSRRERPRPRPLTVCFVLRAPIGGTGGGYMKIFQLARHLAVEGHTTHLYVEPIAHLEGFSEEQIRRYCEKYFGPGGALVHRGHSEIVDCDVAVATNWPTAPVVDALANARSRSYFVQDWEPDFYEADDPLRGVAEATYDLPLLMIGIGRHLTARLRQRNGIDYPHVDFALAPEFFADAASLEARAAGGTGRRTSILFFARPEVPRRAFQLGVEALARLHERLPQVEIRLYGMKERRKLPFPYRNLGILEAGGVARAMREADVHLSFSRTNASTVLFEAMAAGCPAVELDQPGVRSLVSDPEACRLVEDAPEPVALALEELARDADLRALMAQAAVAETRHLRIENMCSQFESILRRFAAR